MRKKVLIIGAGGIGSWVAISLALKGNYSITVFDGDKVDESNLNRLPFKGKVGECKTDALREFLKDNIATNYELKAFALYFNANNSALADRDYDIVVDCTDDFSSQKLVWEWCSNLPGTQYLRVGSRGNHFTIQTELSVWDDGFREPHRCGVHIEQNSEVQQMLGSIVTFIIDNYSEGFSVMSSMTVEKLLSEILGK